MSARGSPGGDGDLHYTMNKEADGETVSFMFQEAFGGRAEFGLVGDSVFRLKASPDGSTWYDALNVDAQRLGTGKLILNRCPATAGSKPPFVFCGNAQTTCRISFASEKHQQAWVQ